ncbi:MAG TPA: hypothetical protein DEA96_19340 [Leptospiraceae bacterium]|nr:hypothetical protein [Spirochaetaceae bacterium]HBS07136.1 hypothetical protein [Leptospiraceae bacterium]
MNQTGALDIVIETTPVANNYCDNANSIGTEAIATLLENDSELKQKMGEFMGPESFRDYEGSYLSIKLADSLNVPHAIHHKTVGGTSNLWEMYAILLGTSPTASFYCCPALPENRPWGTLKLDPDRKPAPNRVHLQILHHHLGQWRAINGFRVTRFKFRCGPVFFLQADSGSLGQCKRHQFSVAVQDGNLCPVNIPVNPPSPPPGGGNPPPGESPARDYVIVEKVNPSRPDCGGSVLAPLHNQMRVRNKHKMKSIYVEIQTCQVSPSTKCQPPRAYQLPANGGKANLGCNGWSPGNQKFKFRVRSAKYM